MLDDLTSYQKTAIETVRNRAIDLRGAARREIDAIMERSALNAGLLDTALAAMQTGARIGLHFHPERLSRTGMSVAEGLLCSGVYTDQFVAGLSSGSPSAFPGRERDFAEPIASDGMLDAANIGPAANPVTLDPKMWDGWASGDDLLAQFRRLWHVLVLTGTPRST